MPRLNVTELAPEVYGAFLQVEQARCGDRPIQV
jgi:hypothetical protein